MGQQRSYQVIENPKLRDLQKAAFKFYRISRAEGFQIAFVGGFAAKMMDSQRETRGLDVLIEPKFFEDCENSNSFARRVIRKYPDDFALALRAAKTPRTPSREQSIVITNSTAEVGVAISFFNSGDKGEFWPDFQVGFYPRSLVPLPHCPMLLRLNEYKPNECVPVLQAHVLLEQRLRRLCNPDKINTSAENDLQDILTFLDYAASCEDSRFQRFSKDKGTELLDLVEAMLILAEKYTLRTELGDERKWQKINVPLGIDRVPVAHPGSGSVQDQQPRVWNVGIPGRWPQ